MLERKEGKKGTTVTFVLPQDAGQDIVSVVGDFNDWSPGEHAFQARPDGTRAVSVLLPAGSVCAFRYLGEDGRWFDEPEPDAHDGVNGYIHA
jgi:1,4-alpha-glucan branching enzyme